MKKQKYGYAFCEAKDNVNPEYVHYLRLYQIDGETPILVDQGLAQDVLKKWERKYNATLIMNPYPDLD